MLPNLALLRFILLYLIFDVFTLCSTPTQYDGVKAKLLRRHIYFSIKKDKINQSVKLRRAKKSKEKVILKDCLLPDNGDDVNAAVIKAALKKEKCKQYYLIHKEIINY